MKESIQRLMTVISIMTVEARKERYASAISLNKKQMEDVEGLMEKERRERKRLEEEKKKIGEKVRGIIREEIKVGIRNYERQRGRKG